MAKIGSRTEYFLSTVDETLREVVTDALVAAPPWLDFAVICGTRTTKQQRALWKQGRDELGNVVRPEEVVTKCDGIRKKSNHQAKVDGGRGTAIDIVAYENGRMTWDEAETAGRAAYIIGFAAARGIKLSGGMKWDWDLGHVQTAD